MVCPNSSKPAPVFSRKTCSSCLRFRMPSTTFAGAFGQKLLVAQLALAVADFFFDLLQLLLQAFRSAATSIFFS